MEGERRETDAGRETEAREMLFTREDIGVIGSYSSFLALLLVTTVLALRDIFEQLIGTYAEGKPGSAAGISLIVSVVLFTLIFLVVPFIPMAASIRRARREGRRWLVFILCYIFFVYCMGLAYQVLYTLLDQLAG